MSGAFLYVKKGGETMASIITVNPGDVIVLKTDSMMNKQTMVREVKWFKEEMNLNVKIIDARYEIAGVEENGERIRETIL